MMLCAPAWSAGLWLYESGTPDLGTAGKAQLEGNRQVYEDLKTMLGHFDLGFEIMPGTGAKDLTPEEKPFQQEEPANTSGG
jgi:hypothetical protein